VLDVNDDHTDDRHSVLISSTVQQLIITKIECQIIL
jgi:hypothetical protein